MAIAEPNRSHSPLCLCKAPRQKGRQWRAERHIFRTTHFSHHPRSKAINMSANCATWTSERIELLKRCLHAGLSCGQTAREIGVTRNAVIGKEPPGPITAQGCDRQAAGAKACRKACPPQDSKDLALEASAPEHLRPA